MNDKTSLETRLSELPRRIEPERDLWPGIQSRLRSRRRRWAIAGGLAAGASAVAVATVVMLGRQGPPATALPAATSTASLAQQATVQRAALSEFALDNSQLDAPTREVVAHNLAIIHAALGNIRSALAKNPNDTRLQSLLLAVEQEEAELLSQAQRAGTESRYQYARTDI